MAIINPYINIPDKAIQSPEDLYGKSNLTNIASMQIGAGVKAFKADQSGIWLGANRFADAPFSVDMDGNITASTLSLTDYLSKTGSNQELSGSVRVGSANIVLDGANKRILINDGTTDRIIIGFQSGGF